MASSSAIGKPSERDNRQNTCERSSWRVRSSRTQALEANRLAEPQTCRLLLELRSVAVAWAGSLNSQSGDVLAGDGDGLD
jgi:hypothetical protein